MPTAKHAAWHKVIWDIEEGRGVPDMEPATITIDNLRGKLQIVEPGTPKPPGATTPGGTVRLRAAADPGDQTVPVHSADDQLRSGKFQGLFKQTGYEHHDSYKDDRALHSTLYCLVRIAQQMQWSTK